MKFHYANEGTDDAGVRKELWGVLQHLNHLHCMHGVRRYAGVELGNTRLSATEICVSHHVLEATPLPAGNVGSRMTGEFRSQVMPVPGVQDTRLQRHGI
jgi:hypothetical protein